MAVELEHAEVKIPKSVYEGIMSCRETGEYNMIVQHRDVVCWLYNHAYLDAFNWIAQNPLSYFLGAMNGFSVLENN